MRFLRVTKRRLTDPIGADHSRSTRVHLAGSSFRFVSIAGPKEQMVKPTPWLLIPAAGLASAAMAAPRPLLTMNFDKGGQAPSAKAPIAPIATIPGPDGASIRPTIDKGTRPALSSGIVSSGCLSPPNCLRVSMAPTQPGAAKNKIMYSFWSHYRALPGGAANRFRIGDDKPLQFQFAMKLDPNYDTPPHQMIHFQVFQAASTGKGRKVPGIEPGGPILSLRIVPQSRRSTESDQVQEFIIVVRNPAATKLYYYGTRDPGVLYRGTMRKGVWTRFNFELLSVEKGSETGGRIRAFMNGRQIVDYRGAWGFSPTAYGAWRDLGLELGAYRSADKTGTQTVYFDNIAVSR